MREMREPDLDRGVDSFNRGDYFGAHEAWEGLWRKLEESPEKHFLQGMIMVAAALHHYKRREHRGAVRLLDRGAELLTRYSAAKVEVDRGDFLKAVGSLIEKLGSAGRELSEDDLPRIKKTVSTR